MGSDFIMQMRPWFGEEEKKAICDYMDTDGFLTEFKLTEQFELMIAEHTGAKHCVVVNNGTISLTLAALSLGIQSGDEVIVPNFTMIATPNSVKMIGAVPVFVDVEPDTLCLDLALVRAAITPRTRAIMLVSANGRFPAAGIEGFVALAQEFGFALIEDAAQSLGSRYPGGCHIGTLGDVGSFSFSAPKIISTGQGGCLITNDEEIASRLRRLKDFGRTTGGIDIHDRIGFNFKFTELQACIGIEQMKKLDSRIAMKKDLFRAYRDQLRGVTGIRLFEHDLDLTVPWFIDCLAERRSELVTYLKDRGIGSRVMYPPIHQQKAYAVPGHHPVSEHIGTHGLWLPSYTQLTSEEITRVCSAIRSFYA